MSEAVDLGEIRRRAAEASSATAASGLSHDALTLELGDLWRDDARHVAAWGQWLLWDETVWRVDNRLAHMTRARAYLREIAESLPLKQADATRRLRSADTVLKVIGLARSNTAQAASVEQWDADPWLLGTPEGTVDLRTGELRPARRATTSRRRPR